MSWYEHFFEGDWLYVQRNFTTPEAAMVTAQQVVALLGLRPGDAVLDVPCGAGRISAPLAALGMRVVGVDRTPALLDDARALGLEVHERDMRDLPWEGVFDAACNLWGSFGYLGEDGDEAFAAATCRALKPGGRFVIDVPGLETLLPTYTKRGWWKVADALILEDRDYDLTSGNMCNTWTIVRDGQASVRRSEIRIYSFPELRRLLLRAGYASVVGYGHVDGTPLALGKRLVVVATKPAP